MSKAALGRFAPTPSGRIHLGNAFSYLLAWLSARKEEGEILLRMEDLDTLRCSDAFAQDIREDLLWLGLDWDYETPPQRNRTDAYEAALEVLRSRANVFPCWCTRGSLNLISAPHASDGHPIHPAACRERSEEERRSMKGKPAFRLEAPDLHIAFRDGVYGDYAENLRDACGDFVLRRADGVFVYQLAVVVDDGAAGVTQIVRGCDLLSSTPRQLYLYRLLGLEAPDYYHVPMLTDPEGRKLSKRDGDMEIRSLRSRMQPQEVLGKLAFAAGLIPKEEALSARELLEEFSWETLRREDIVLSPGALM